MLFRAVQLWKQQHQAAHKQEKYKRKFCWDWHFPPLILKIIKTSACLQTKKNLPLKREENLMMQWGWECSGPSRGFAVKRASIRRASRPALEKGAMGELCQGRAPFALQPFNTSYSKATQQVILKTNTHTFPETILLFERQVKYKYECTGRRETKRVAELLHLHWSLVVFSLYVYMCVLGVEGTGHENLSHPRMRKLDRGQSSHLLHHENLCAWLV